MVTFGQSIREGFMDVVSDDVERVTGARRARCDRCSSSTGTCGRHEEGPRRRAAGTRRLHAGHATPDRGRSSVIGAGDDWDNPGGDWAGSHFSRLTDITPANVGELGLAWEYDLGTARVQEATPVVIDGVMYTSGNLGGSMRSTPRPGEELWTFEPEVDMQANRSACCDQANRGVQVHDGKVFVGALDGWLYALDARTGAVAWKVDTIVDRKRAYTEHRRARDRRRPGGDRQRRRRVRRARLRHRLQRRRRQRGMALLDHPARSEDGPQESEALEAAVKTWDPKSRWDIGGGGSVWDAIQYDPLFDQVIIGVGNGGPYPLHTRSPEGGDNLYLNSLVALDRETGEMKWHFQETPTDSWDLTATQPMVFTEMEVGGRSAR
jgi:quinohemoprotein ethanol dehydrogenase